MDKKKVILHPTNPKTGETVTDIELYPECFKDGIINRDGSPAVENAPLENSENLITSGAVYNVDRNRIHAGYNGPNGESKIGDVWLDLEWY